MSDRLEDLRRQRALIQEHLAWLDREIAAIDSAEKSTRVPPSAPIAAPKPAPISAVVPIVAAAAPAVSVPEFADYQADPESTQKETKRGCLVLSAIVMVLFFTALAVIYLVAYRDYPLFGAEKPPIKSRP